jgi:hypothetical protein
VTDSEGTEVGGIFENDIEDDEEQNDAEEGGLQVAAFIDKVNGAENDEELDEQKGVAESDGDSEESEFPDEVVFVGGRPSSSSSCSSSSVLAIQNVDYETNSVKPKKKGRPKGSKNLAKKKA